MVGYNEWGMHGQPVSRHRLLGRDFVRAIHVKRYKTHSVKGLSHIFRKTASLKKV